MLHATCYEEYLAKVSRLKLCRALWWVSANSIVSKTVLKVILKQPAKPANDVDEDCVCCKK